MKSRGGLHRARLAGDQGMGSGAPQRYVLPPTRWLRRRRPPGQRNPPTGRRPTAGANGPGGRLPPVVVGADDRDRHRERLGQRVRTVERIEQTKNRRDSPVGEGDQAPAAFRARRHMAAAARSNRKPAGWATQVAHVSSPRFPGAGWCVAVAIAKRLSAPLIAKDARKAREARGSQSAVPQYHPGSAARSAWQPARRGIDYDRPRCPRPGFSSVSE